MGQAQPFEALTALQVGQGAQVTVAETQQIEHGQARRHRPDQCWARSRYAQAVPDAGEPRHPAAVRGHQCTVEGHLPSRRQRCQGVGDLGKAALRELPLRLTMWHTPPEIHARQRIPSYFHS